MLTTTTVSQLGTERENFKRYQKRTSKNFTKSFSNDMISLLSLAVNRESTNTSVQNQDKLHNLEDNREKDYRTVYVKRPKQQQTLKNTKPSSERRTIATQPRTHPPTMTVVVFYHSAHFSENGCHLPSMATFHH